MVRTVNQEEYAAKRQEILSVAQKLIYTKGYERMTLLDMLRELNMSNGSFYHYFDSKPAVLEALIERMQQEAEQQFLPTVHDPRLSALEKLDRYFNALNQLKAAHQSFVLGMLRVWYTDDNAIVRQKVDAATIRRRAPLLDEIVRQGIQERTFTLSSPERMGEIILYLIHGMSNTHADLLLSLEHDQDEQRCIDGIVAAYAAYMDAIERVLGTSANSLYRADTITVRAWVTALRNGS